MSQASTNPWQSRRVLVTGHTGFKGSWLSLWLHSLGARVTGYALPPPTTPSLFEAAGMAALIDHVEGDIRDLGALRGTIESAQPEVIFHLAAQPLVRLSYEQPVETYATNVMGTVHLLEAARQVPGIKAVICITSDKCYENREWVWPYRESDPMGGHDPYSSSKGCAELVVSAYRSSYLSSDGPALASVRAGNVIGGGDWAVDRLVPDLVRAFEAGTSPLIRSPDAVRPWQHVLEALGGYLLLGERLLAGERDLAQAWNFGPSDEDARTVLDRREDACCLGRQCGRRTTRRRPQTARSRSAPARHVEGARSARLAPGAAVGTGARLDCAVAQGGGIGRKCADRDIVADRRLSHARRCDLPAGGGLKRCAKLTENCQISDLKPSSPILMTPSHSHVLQGEIDVSRRHPRSFECAVSPSSPVRRGDRRAHIACFRRGSGRGSRDRSRGRGNAIEPRDRRPGGHRLSQP